MANPAAPAESGGLKLAFLLADDGAAGNEAVLAKSLEERTAIINGSTDKAGPTVTQVEGEDGTLLTSAARTADTNSTDQVNHGWAGVMIIVDVTSITATPSVVPEIQIKDPVTGNYFTIAAFVAITDVTGTGTYVYTLRPGVAESIAVANHEIQALSLPKSWRLNMNHGDTDSITYSVGFSYLK